MPSQQQEMLEMISNLKKALRREKEPPSSQSIYGISNRGNKLKRGANHVHLGSLANTNGPEPYKQKIEHAGFSRYILERKPARYNDYGDELSNFDSEEEADTYAEEIDPYEGIRLEELLRPLTHPSELATHPTLSLPYLDSALPEMVKTAEEKLRQERANLWQAKALNRQLLGDEAWIPLSVVESSGDWDLFEPRPPNAAGPVRKRRKMNGKTRHIDLGEVPVERIEDAVNGVAAETDVDGPSNSDAPVDETAQVSNDTEMIENAPLEQPTMDDIQQEEQQINGGVAIEDTKPEIERNDNENSEDTLPAEDEPMEDQNEEQQPKDDGRVGEDNQDAIIPHGSGESSPAPLPRRITRALAAGNNGNSGAGSPVHSPSPTPTSSDSSLLQIDPIFLLPPAIHATNRMSALYGLPADEAVETRKLLTAYIQKQEECVRGLESVAAKLISALKLRKEVWDMCKAEGHVGELSDGEDWIDAEAWGLKDGELRKGRFEEEDIQEEREAIGGGRKGKRRRREQN